MGKRTFTKYLATFLSAAAASLCTACGTAGYGAQTARPRTPVYHVIVQGESIPAVAKRYGVETQTVMLLNGLRDHRAIRIGQRLFMGYRREGPTVGIPPVPDRSPAPAPAPVQTGVLSWPLNGGRLVSTFGPRWGSFHDGVDFAAPSGTAVFASHNGTVSYAGQRLRGYGKLVIVQGADGLITVYAHNRKLNVRKGERVRRGQQIAEVGSTGRSSGPHLHFEVRMKDRLGRYVAIDPVPLLKGNGVKPRYRVNESLTPLLAKRSN